MADTIYYLLEVSDFLIVYLVLFRLKLNKKIQIIELICMAFFFGLLASILPEIHAIKDLVPIIMLFVAVLISDTKSLRDFAKYFPFVFLISSDINILGSLVMAEILHVNQNEIADNMVMTNIAELSTLALFIIILIFDNKKNFRITFYSKWQYLILLVGLFIIFIIVGLIQYVMKRGTNYSRELNIMMIAFLAFTACFFILFILMQLVWQKALKYKLESEREKYSLEKQEIYIKHINDENKARRKMQHDINAHITAINGMIEDEDWDELKAYAAKLEKDGQKKASIYCGLPAIDAILSDFEEKMIANDIRWKHFGGILPEKEVDTYEVSIIIYNLLKNALEACVQLPDNRYITCGIEVIHGKIKISVENSCLPDLVIDKIPETTKADKESHGFGLKNVKDIVDKHCGRMNVSARDGVFKVIIIY